VKPLHRRIQRKTTDGAVSEEEDASGDGRRPIRTGRKGPPEDGTPSTTTIYVANIPFEYTDEKVRALCSSLISITLLIAI
jgi:RNA recognition motif-containing protein